MRQLLLAVWTALVVACGTTASGPVSSGSGGGGGPPPPPPPSGGVDAGAPDAGAADAGSTADAGATGDDAGVSDSGPGSTDGGTAGGSDGGAISADCKGIVPGSLGSSFSFDVPPPAGGTTQCDSASSDEQGNLIAKSTSAPYSNGPWRWELFSPSGAHTGHIDGTEWMFPEGPGFVGIEWVGHGPLYPGLSWWLPDGTRQRITNVGGDETGASEFRAWPSGVVEVSSGCSVGPPGGLSVTRFDAQGQKSSSGEMAGGCNFLTAVGDANGNSLVLIWNPGKAVIEGTWFDSAGNALASSFAVGPGPIDALLLHAVAGGGAVLAAGGEWKWFIHSGSAQVDAVPEWLALHSGYDFTVVRGARAYALLSRTSGDPHVIDLVSTQGNRCGSLTFPVGGLTTGADGSVIGASGNAGCTKTVWPGLLR